MFHDEATRSRLRRLLEPRGLAKRIALSFAVLITAVAAVYSLAIKESVDFAESTLMSSFMKDELSVVKKTLTQGAPLRLTPSIEVFGEKAPLKPVPADLANAPLGFSERGDRKPAVFLYRSRWEGGDILLVRDQEGFEIEERRVWLQTILSVASVLFLSALIGFWLTKRIIMRPVRQLACAVRSAAHTGEDWKPIDRSLMTEDEIGELAQICNDALRRLHEALAREKAFTGDVSHELRTPLTVIETSVELLLLSPLSPKQIEQADRILRSAQRMRELVTLFLQLARLQEGSKRIADDTVETLCRRLTEVWRPIAEKKGLVLDCLSLDRCPGSYSPVILGAVMNNLLKNAVQYTPSGRVALCETRTGFIVKDTGPGIPDDERTKIFSAFQRGRNAEGEGTGLGLSIALRICRRMGWQLELLDSPAGAVFRVTLAAGEAAGRADLINEAEKNRP